MKKFPFPKVLGSPSPVGQAASRALDMVDAPFLTRRIGNTIADKAGEFSYVRTIETPDDLGLVTVFSTPTEQDFAEPSNKKPLVSRALTGGSASKGTNVTSAMGAVPAVPTIPGATKSFINGRTGAVHVGGGYVLWCRQSYQRDVPFTNWSFISTWPVLTYVKRPGTEDEPAEDSKSVSYALTGATSFQELRSTTTYSTAKHLADMSMSAAPYGVFALGQNDDGDYVFGVSSLTYTLGVGVYRHQIAIGNTKTKALSTKFTRDCSTLPVGSGRSSMSRVFCTGRGKARALYVTCTDADVSANNVNNLSVYTVRTDDFGETWSIIHEPVLEDVISPWVTADLLPYNSSALQGIEPHVLIGYMGEGKHFLYFSAGDTTGYVTQVTPGPSTTTRPVLFIGDDDGYTQASWPADAWRSRVNGPLDARGQRGWMGRSGTTWRSPYTALDLSPWGLPSVVMPADFVRNDLYSLTYYGDIDAGCAGPSVSWAADNAAKNQHWSFGEGCLMVPIRHWNPKAWKIMLTTDFGATWDTKDLPEDLWPAGYRSPPIVVQSSWKDGVSDGSILIGQQIQGKTEIVWWKTTDLFDTFTKALTVSAGVDLPYGEFDPDGCGGDTGLLIMSNKKLAPPFPAFPNDFKGE